MGQNAFTKIPRLFFVAGRKCITHPREALLLCRMAWWVGFLSASARWLSLPRALELVSGGESRQVATGDAELPRQLARSIDSVLSANVLFFRPICWKRAAVLHRYLALNGITSRIVFGVRKGPQGEIDGHAWLESGGEPILEATAPNYKVTYAFPSHDPFEVDLASLS